MFVYLAGEDDDDLPEDLDEVDEELDGVADVVAVAAPLLLDDHLGVPDDEAAEQQEAAPEIDLFYWVEMSFMKSLVFVIKFDKNLKLRQQMLV